MSLIGWYLLIAVSCLHWPSTQSGKRRKLRLDLILAVGPAGDRDLEDDVKKTLKNLTDEYILGKEFSRVAVLWSPHGSWDTSSPDRGFTNNATQFNDYVKSMDLSGTDTGTKGPDMLLISLQASLFSTIPDNSRARFLIFVYPIPCYLLEPQSYVKRTVISLAKEADFFVLVSGGDKDRLDKITTDPRRLKRANNATEFRQLLPHLFGSLTEELIYNHSCKYSKACLTTGGSCAKGWWTPRLPTSYFDCASIRSPPNTKPTGSCEAYECDQLCDAWWPATSTCTDETCGQPRKREGDPPWNQLKNCPPTKRSKYQCGKCTNSSFIRPLQDMVPMGFTSTTRPDITTVIIIVSTVVGALVVFSVVAVAIKLMLNGSRMAHPSDRERPENTYKRGKAGKKAQPPGPNGPPKNKPAATLAKKVPKNTVY